VNVAGDSVEVDFSRSDDQQKDSVNATIVIPHASVYYVFRCLVDPDIPPNAGAYRPFTIKAREGSVVSACFPAPVGTSTIIAAQKVVDVLLGALLSVFEDRTQAASYGVTSLCNIGGSIPGTAALYSYVETYAGGQGAMHDLDGMDAVQTHMTNTRNAPVEVIESTYPISVESYGLIQDSEGAGRQRGGTGMRRKLVVEGEDAVVTVCTDRRRLRPWGVFGGMEGAGSDFHIVKRGAERQELPSTKVTTPVDPGDSVVIVTPGGGGWGDPAARDPECVRWDVLEGIISAERARDVYRVAVDLQSMQVDREQTRRLRGHK
jgi:N-methylhydantoinase B